MPGALSWNPDLASLTQCWCPLPWEGGGKCHPRTEPWTSLSTGLVVNRRRCRAKGALKALGCIVYIFSCGDDTGGARKMEAGLTSKKAVTGLYFKYSDDNLKLH